ncbi:MAG: TauD/TfdA dioxygenase family protein [Acidimicrobiales bacterium]|jgi:taurine dioxygenase
MPIALNPLGQAAGADVTGVDLTQLNADDLDAVNDAWNTYGVLFFRDQAIRPEQHIALAEKFAPIDVNQFFASVPEHPEVALVLKEADHTVNIGGGWHTDHSYDIAPARGSILVARDVPPMGGDTHFANTAAAYDALSDGFREMLDGLEAHHSNEHIFGPDSAYAKSMGDRFTNPVGVGSTTHPVVIQHPVTGRRVLYVNPGFTTGIVGWSDEESKALLKLLFGHITETRFVTKFSWEPGSVAMWDNRSTWHYALNDYQGHRREMHRITIEGVPLVGV